MPGVAFASQVGLGQKAAELGMSVDELKHEIDAGTPLKSIERKHEAAGVGHRLRDGGERGSPSSLSLGMSGRSSTAPDHHTSGSRTERCRYWHEKATLSDAKACQYIGGSLRSASV